MNKAILVFAVALQALPASASDWHQLMVSDTGSMYFIDIDTVRSNKGGMLTLWSRVDGIEGPIMDDVYAIRSLEEADCSKKTTRSLSATAFNKKGLTVSMNTTLVNNMSIYKDTVGTYFLTVVCSERFPKKINPKQLAKVIGNRPDIEAIVAREERR